MKVIILGAGQGKRLLPLTQEVPKALLDIGGKTLVRRQIDAFAACGLTEFVVITGYNAHLMEDQLEETARETGLTIRTVYNPFFAVSDNLASCWMARHEMHGEFIQVNGDNVFQADLAQCIIDGAKGDVTVATNFKDTYDADDMKVMMDGDQLTEVGKMLPVEAVDAEAIGFYVFKGAGTDGYRAVLEETMRDPSGLKQWFPSAVGTLAKQIHIGVVNVGTREWSEVDFPVDLQAARQMVAGWDE